jgi:hypothetical protein
MDTQEAMRALVAASRDAEVVELLTDAAEKVERSYRAVREDRMLSDEARKWQMAVAFSQTRRTVDQRLSEMASRTVRDDRDDAARVFGVKGLAGDQASLVISRRDAGDRVAQVTERAELRELLRRATRTGDEVLARAVAERAVTEEDVKTMEEFLNARPELESAGERLWNANRAGGGSMLGFNMHLSALTPPELSGMGRDAIEHLAQTGQPSSS